jgi:aerobic carbon-monoxide dehydrogenase small subunit
VIKTNPPYPLHERGERRLERKKQITNMTDSNNPKSDTVHIRFTLNREPVEIESLASDSALTLLRDRLGLTGAKEGCGIGECGACTIIVDGLAVNSCLMLAPQLEGREVETVEGLSDKGLVPLQDAFVHSGGVQCGFCTPGMLMSAKSLLEKNLDPSREEIKEALAGNLCRCTGYVQIVDAVQAAADKQGQPRGSAGEQD